MQSKLKYIKILKNICNYYGIDEEKFIELLKNRENKYILLLILKNNNCLDKEKVKEIFKLKTSSSISNSLRLAEEKLLINKIFREKYFELENNIEKNDMSNLQKKTRYK
jgi:phage antirepressor YoqD-like protein